MFALVFRVSQLSTINRITSSLFAPLSYGCRTLLQISAVIYQVCSFIFTLRISLILSSIFGFVFIIVHKTLIWCI